MADAKGPVINPVDDLKILIFFIVILWLVWFSLGGPDKYGKGAQFNWKAPEPVSSDSGGSYSFSTSQVVNEPHVSQGDSLETKVSGNSQAEITSDVATKKSSDSKNANTAPTAEKEQHSNNSSGISLPFTPVLKFKPDLSINGDNLSKSANSKYLTLDYSSSNVGPLDISGLTVRNYLGGTFEISGASLLPMQGKINNELDVSIQPDSKVYLIGGESPLGVSFRVNKCMVYLAQFQVYTPPLPAECPECQFSPDHSFTYNDCILLHNDDPDFYKDDWRMYVGNAAKVWKDAGGLRLEDKAGNTIAGGFF